VPPLPRQHPSSPLFPALTFMIKLEVLPPPLPPYIDGYLAPPDTLHPDAIFLLTSLPFLTKKIYLSFIVFVVALDFFPSQQQPPLVSLRPLGFEDCREETHGMLVYSFSPFPVLSLHVRGGDEGVFVCARRIVELTPVFPPPFNFFQQLKNNSAPSSFSSSVRDLNQMPFF